MDPFEILVFTPPSCDDLGLAVAASRAGAIGVFNAEFHAGRERVQVAVRALAGQANGTFGVKLGPLDREMFDWLLARTSEGLGWLILDVESAESCLDRLAEFPEAGRQLLIEIPEWRAEYMDRFAMATGWVVKGHESGGFVGEQPSMILLQQLLEAQHKPVYVRGGVGVHTAAACHGAGARGVVLDNQLLLLEESCLRETLRSVLRGHDRSETIALGDPSGRCYFRLLRGPDPQIVETLRESIGQLPRHEFRAQVVGLGERRDTAQPFLPLGQDVCLAASWSERYGSLANALRALRERVSKPADIAIVGIGCLLPKARNRREFWENILDNADAITEIPRHRWDWRLYFDPDRTAKDKIYSKWGGFLEDLVFDPLRYGIPPKSIPAIDPLQLMTLEVVRQALQDAGYADREFNRERASLILGASGGAGDVGAQYAVRSETVRFAGELAPEVAERLPEWSEDSFAGILLNVAAGRAANRFDFGGVNFTVDAACASSLTAVYQAVVELQDRRSDMVIAGGVDTVQGPFGYLCFSKTQALSPRGRCSTFDASADGIVISEGIAMVVLKRLEDARRDGDRIYAVIKGIGGSSDGRAKSMTAPHPDGQIRALERAYAAAGFSPATVGMFEAHGTGTVAGDTAELETVTRVLGRHGAQPKQSALGSVKALIGHTKATAGVAGLIKAALALHHRTLPGQPNVTAPNPKIADPESPLFLLKDPLPWIANGQHPRRASVSAFGFGGTNFHATLEEHRSECLPSEVAPRDRWPAELLVWRGPDRPSLVASVKRTSRAIAQGPAPSLRDLAYTLARTAPDRGEAAVLIVREEEDLGQRLAELVAHLEESSRRPPPGVYHATQPLRDQGQLALLFAGQGSQYPNMLRELAVLFPDIPRVLERADSLLAVPIENSAGQGARLSRLIYPPGLYSPEEETAAANLLTRTEIAQPALGAVEVGLLHLLRRLGVRPEMACGHSYGEYVALHAAGVLGLDDLLLVSEARGRFMVECSEGNDLGTMAAVQAGREDVERIVRLFPDVVVANHNAPLQSILSGSKKSIHLAVEQLTAEGIPARPLMVGAAFHSPFVAPARDRLADFIAKLDLRPPDFPVYSNTTARPHSADPAKLREVLADHLVKPVEFVDEIEAMYQAGARLFVGIGPKNVPVSFVDRILAGRPHRIVRIDDHAGGLKGLLHALGDLIAEGVEIDLSPLFAARDCREIDLEQPQSWRREAVPPAHAWLLNGSAARKIGEAAIEPLTLEQVEERSARRASDQPAATPVLRAVRSIAEETMTIPRRTDPPVVFAGESTTGAEANHESVLASYHETMRRFLEVQESVMLSYLSGTGIRRALGPVRALPPPPRAGDARVVESRAAVPAPRVRPEAPAQPAAASETTRRVEAFQTPSPERAVVVPPKPATAEAPVDLDHGGVTALLLGIVEECTGYERTMLGLDQQLEADLGIDSIKRVEIVGRFVKALPQKLMRALDGNAEALTKERTLQGIIARVVSNGDHGGTARPFEPAGAGSADVGRVPPPRFTMVARPEPLADPPLQALERGPYLITDDGLGLAAELAARLDQYDGVTPIVVAEGILRDDTRLAALIDDVRRDHGAVRGCLHLAAGSTLGGAIPLEMWHEQTERNDVALFRLMRLLGGDLREGGRVLAASGLGGTFAREANGAGILAQGGAVGLIKSLCEEWPGLRAKAVDLDPASPVSVRAAALLTELRLAGGRREVGYPEGQRTVFVTESAPLKQETAPARQVDPAWVVLATGGARGITAEALRGLAGHGLQLVVVGRTPEPVAESVETAGTSDAQELRQHFIEVARREGRRPRPVDIEKQVTGLRRDRELAANLEDLRRSGARVEYRVADVLDEKQMREVVDGIYLRYGRLDGVVHGAGIIEDKRLEDKTLDSWRRVFRTKVDGAFLLTRLLRPEGLSFLAFFSSVAGRYGNSGQTDYAAANELLNRLAWQVHREWGGKVKVVSLNWGPWESTRHGTGMVTADTRRKFEERGVVLVPAGAGSDLFLDELLRGPLTDVEVVVGEGPWEEHESARASLQQVPRRPPKERARAIEAEFPFLAGMTVERDDSGEIRFSRTLDLELDHYLREHRVDEKPVLPAAVALEFMAEAAASYWPDRKLTEVRNLRALRGVVMERPRVDLTVTARVEGDHESDRRVVKLELRAGNGSGPPNYRATALFGRTLLEPIHYTPTPQTFKPSTLDIERVYREWLFHGPCFEVMRRLIGLDDQGAAVEVQATDPKAWLPGVDSARGWLFDPGLLDSGPQMAIVWARANRDQTALPTRMGCVQRYGNGPCDRLRMYFVLRPGTINPEVKAEVAFVDERERLRLRILDLECTSSAALNRLGGGWRSESILAAD